MMKWRYALCLCLVLSLLSVPVRAADDELLTGDPDSAAAEIEDVPADETVEDVPVEEAVEDTEPIAEESEESDPDVAEVILEPETPEPIVTVDVPDFNRIIVNPYNLPVTADGQKSTDQIINRAQVLVSASSVPISVDVSVTGIIPTGSNAVFTSVSPDIGAEEKAVFLYVEFQTSEDADANVMWFNSYSDAPNQVLVTGEGTSKDAVMTLPAGNETPSYCAYRLFGAASVPIENPWTAEDAIKIDIVFTFTPVIPETFVEDVPVETFEEVIPAEPDEQVEADGESDDEQVETDEVYEEPEVETDEAADSEPVEDIDVPYGYEPVEDIVAEPDESEDAAEPDEDGAAVDSENAALEDEEQSGEVTEDVQEPDSDAQNPSESPSDEPEGELYPDDETGAEGEESPNLGIVDEE